MFHKEIMSYNPGGTERGCLCCSEEWSRTLPTRAACIPVLRMALALQTIVKHPARSRTRVCRAVHEKPCRGAVRMLFASAAGQKLSSGCFVLTKAAPAAPSHHTRLMNPSVAPRFARLPQALHRTCLFNQYSQAWYISKYKQPMKCLTSHLFSAIIDGALTKLTVIQSAVFRWCLESTQLFEYLMLTEAKMQ